MNKKIVLIALILTALMTFVSCKQTDVVANASITSFEQVLNAISDKIVADEMNGGWSLSAPDATARFIWSKDFSKSPMHDAMLEFDAKPFIDAGLDINKLPDGVLFDNKIMVGTKLSDKAISYNGQATPLDSYKKIVEYKREAIKYHVALDHYGVELSGGNMFEWAKDMSKNDKDIVFVLNPQMFIDAGVNVEKVSGWVFAKVPTMDADGKKIEVDKLLKPFNIK
jgi:hypothetical protein